MFTASTEHDSKTVNTITNTCLGNMNSLVMEESVYNGGDKSSRNDLVSR